MPVASTGRLNALKVSPALASEPGEVVALLYSRTEM
jgi:hypothetical protein